MKRLGIALFILAVIALVLFAVWKIQDMSPRYHYRLGRQAQKEHDYETAIEQYSRVAQLDSHYPNIFLWRGGCYYVLDQLDLALADCDRHIQLRPNDVLGYQLRGDAHMVKGDCRLAIADYTRSIELQPDNARAYRYRAEAYFANREVPSALADYTKSIEQDPRIPETYVYRAEAHIESKEYDKALIDCDKALEINPKLSRAYLDKGRTYRRMRDYSHAEACLLEALNCDPNEPYAYNGLAWLWATCPVQGFRHGPKAVEYATKANNLTSSKDPYVLDTLAAAYAEVGQYDEAVQWLKKALQNPELLEPDDLEKDKKALTLYQAHKPFRDE